MAEPLTEAMDFPETPEGWAMLWKVELQAAKEILSSWWEKAEKCIARYIDDRQTKAAGETRLNLYTSNTDTTEALLLGKIPSSEVSRTFDDSGDDAARVASEVLERLLNTSLEKEGGKSVEAFRHALQDWRRAGMGSVRLRYEIGETVKVPGTPAITHPATGQELAPAVPEQEQRPNEQAVIEYSYWKHELWSPCNVYEDLRWRAFKSPMSRKQLVKRFGEKIGNAVPLNTSNKIQPGEEATKYKDPLGRADVWEIWSKERGTVDWYVEGYPRVLDHKDDPLGLEGFFPSPRPMFSNLTTSKLVPTPDFVLAQDLYDSIDELDTRINLLISAVRVAGLYDGNDTSIKQLLKGKGNDLYPVTNWAVFAEKGGIDGAVSWLPLEMIVKAIELLTMQMDRQIMRLQQVTGMSDIIRGESDPRETLGAQQIKSKFASVRIQTMQDEFARFCGEAKKLEAEIIAKHFDPATIRKRSNVDVMETVEVPDPATGQTRKQPNDEIIGQALQLIKAPDFDFRIVVNPDSVALQDFAALKQESMEFAQAISAYIQGMIPLVQMVAPMPGAAPRTIQFIMELGQTLTRGLQGASSMEGIFDRYAADLDNLAKQPPPPPQPDPQMQVAQIKAEAEGKKAQVEVAKSQMDAQAAQMEHGMKLKEMAVGHQIAMADHAMDMQKHQTEMERIKAEAATEVDRVTEDRA